MLGHESLESIQIYTRVTINDLKEIHAKYHPEQAVKAAKYPRSGLGLDTCLPCCYLTPDNL